MKRNLIGKTVLISGGSGFIGRNLCNKFQELGSEVFVISRFPTKTKKYLPSCTNIIDDIEDLEKDLHIDYLINLAGQRIDSKRWTKKTKRQIYSSRIDTTHQLREYFTKARKYPKVVLSASAVGYYGNSKQLLDENSPGRGGFSHTLCKDWENSASEFQQFKSRVCFLRFGVVLGEGGALGKMRAPFKLGLGGKFGDGSQIMSWIHIDDVVQAILFCLNNSELSGPINFVAPNPVSNSLFVKNLSDVLSVCSRLDQPRSIIKLLFGEMGEEILLSDQYVLPKKLMSHGYTFKYSDNFKALQAIFSK